MACHFGFQPRKISIKKKRKKKNLFETLSIVSVDFHQIPFHLSHRWLIENVAEYFVVVHHKVELALLLLSIAFA
jgi:hypothetical protein